MYEKKIQRMYVFKTKEDLHNHLEKHTKTVNHRIKAIEKENGVDDETGFMHQMDASAEFKSKSHNGELLFTDIPYTLESYNKEVPILLFYGLKILLDYLDEKLKEWQKNPTQENLIWIKDIDRYAEIKRFVPHVVAHYEYRHAYEYHSSVVMTPEKIDSSFKPVFENWYEQPFYIGTEQMIYTVNRNDLTGLTSEWNRN